MDNTKKHLQDILTAIDEIDSFFGTEPKLFNEFAENICLRRAVERNIEVIGEAMNRILKSGAEVQITNSRKIVDARNYIIHGYDSLSVDILWSIVINHLPKLKAEVTELLKYIQQNPDTLSGFCCIDCTNEAYDLFVKIYARNNDHLLTLFQTQIKPLGLILSKIIISFRTVYNKQLTILPK